MKRIGGFAAVAIVLALLFAVSVSAALLGDADNDGKVKAGDARLILRHAARIEQQTDEFILKLMDVDGNGSVKSADARLALRMASRQDPTREYIEPSSGDVPTIPTTAPGETTSETETAPPVPTEPTTVAPEPTTEAPTEPVTTEPVTTEPVTTEAPTEPTTTETPTEPSTEATTEPSTAAPEEPTTEAVPGVRYHDSFYIDADIITYEEGVETSQRLKFACHKEEVKPLFGKTYTVSSQYFCTDSFNPGHDIGILIRDENGGGKTLYMIDCETNEYTVINSLTLKVFEKVEGFDLDSILGDESFANIAMPTFDNLSNLDVTEEEYEGKTYQVVTTVDGLNTSKYYIEKRGDEYYPVIAESFEDGKLIAKMHIYTFETDGSPYTAVPTGTKMSLVTFFTEKLSSLT